MSVCWVSSYPENKKRAISFVTTAAPQLWLNTVKTIPYNKQVDDFEIFRSSRAGSICYDMTTFVNYEPADNESEDQTLQKVFGDKFLRDNLPVHNVEEMGPFAKSSKSKDSNAPLISPEVLFVIYDTIDQNNVINTSAYAHCYEEFSKMGDQPMTDLAEKAQVFKDLAKKHGLEGGSWLVMPKTYNDQEHLAFKCRRYFDLLLPEFVNGSLQDEYINRISYSKMKQIVKVSNRKTVYFDFTEAAETKGPNYEEEVFRADKEVRKTYQKIVNIKLRDASLKYKPEVYSACKLNAKNVTSRLTLYTELPFDRKMAIAKEP